VTQKSERETFIQVKTALADKYERLARTRHSKPAKLNLLRHSKRFRDQAAYARKGISK
jgi:hypothetical protein